MASPEKNQGTEEVPQWRGQARPTEMWCTTFQPSTNWLRPIPQTICLRWKTWRSFLCEINFSSIVYSSILFPNHMRFFWCEHQLGKCSSSLVLVHKFRLCMMGKAIECGYSLHGVLLIPIYNIDVHYIIVFHDDRQEPTHSAGSLLGLWFRGTQLASPCSGCPFIRECSALHSRLARTIQDITCVPSSLFLFEFFRWTLKPIIND